MNNKLTAAEKRYQELVRSIGCVVCKRMGIPVGHAEIHHIAQGTSPQNNWLIAPLCKEHHDGDRRGTGLHGMGARKFCMAFRVPHLTEYGLLAWVHEDLEKE